MTTPGIYAIVHRLSGRRYVGQSVSIEKRWKEHRWDLRRGTHHCEALQQAWDTFGAHAFDWTILETVTDEQARDHRELLYITETADPFNTSRLTTTGPQPGYRHRPETIEKMRAAAKGRKHGPTSEETKAKISQAMKGRVFSPETLAKMSAASKARAQFTDEHRAAISKAMKKSLSKPEVKAKLSALRKGKRWSESARAAHMAARVGKPWSHKRREMHNEKRRNALALKQLENAKTTEVRH